MMIKVLITGNGFDLYYGLPTRYKDFINIMNYVVGGGELEYEKVYDLVEDKDLLKRNFSRFDINKEGIEDLIHNLKNNSWYNYFKKEFEIETWIDFEQKIQMVSEQVFEFFKEDTQHLTTHRRRGKKVGIQLVTNSPSEKERNVIHRSALQIIKDVITGDSFNLKEDFLKYDRNYYLDYDIDAIAKFLIGELNDFKKIFNKYFELFVCPLYSEYNDTMDNQELYNFKHHYTFNYTPTYDKLVRGGEYMTEHIHGYINKSENNIVLGISEVPYSIQDNKNLVGFTKYFQRVNNDLDTKFIDVFNEYVDYEDVEFYFFGHSLDKSDEEYIKEVFDFVDNRESDVKRIVIVYHSEPAKTTMQVNLFDVIGRDIIMRMQRNDSLLFKKVGSSQLKELIKAT